MPRPGLPPHPSLPAVLALTLTLLPVRAFATPDPVLAAPGLEVRAGQVVELSWGELPVGAGEMEILLSLDDGRSFPIRVSPELDAHERRYRWRVPNLPTDHARLRVRLGTDRAEIATAPTAPFRIVGSEAGPAARRLMLEGPLWTGVAPFDSGERGMLSGGACMSASDPTIAAVEAPDDLGVPRPAPTASAPAAAERPTAPHAPLIRAIRPPRLTPLRN